MFDSIRKHQRLLQFVLLLLIFPAFAFFGVSGYQKFLGDDDAVATVDASQITRQEFEEARRRQFERIRQVLGQQADPKLLDSPEVVRGILDELIAQRTLQVAAERRRVVTTDERLRESILGIKGLTRDDGSFDLERYRALLSAQGLTEQSFEATTRRELTVQAMPDAIAYSAFVPAALADRVIALEQQRREVRELLIKPADFASQVKVDDAQLRKHYDDNAKSYETTESARVEYLVLSAESLAAQIALGESDLETYYEQNKARYASPESRKASHILIKAEAGASEDARKAARARAESLLKQAQGGADFAALARANSQDPGSAASGGDLGFFTRDSMVKPFADAAFGLKEGELSGIVESEFGFHLIRLTGIRQGSVRAFAQVRAEIETEVRRQQASKRFAEAAEGFSNIVYEQSDSLKPAAERFKLDIRTVDDLTRAGTGRPGAREPVANPKVLAALFSAESVKTRRNTEAIDIGGNTLVSARIVEHHPAQRKPFESVRAAVLAQVTALEAGKLARTAGEARLQALRSGAADRQGFAAPKSLVRTERAAVLPAAQEAVFKAPVDKLPAFVGVDLGSQGYAVYEITALTMPSAEEIAKNRAAFRQQIARVEGQQAVLDFVESLKGRARIDSHPERVIRSAER